MCTWGKISSILCTKPIDMYILFLLFLYELLKKKYLLKTVEVEKCMNKHLKENVI